MNLLHRTYRKFRAEGLRASHAMHAARTELAWDEAEAAGLVTSWHAVQYGDNTQIAHCKRVKRA